MKVVEVVRREIKEMKREREREKQEKRGAQVTNKRARRAFWESRESEKRIIDGW